MPHRENNDRPCWTNTSRNALSFVTQDRTKGFLAPLSRGRHTVPVREVHRSRKSDEPYQDCDWMVRLAWRCIQR